MNRNLNPKIVRQLASALSESVKTEAIMLQSVEGLKNKETKEGFANIIRKTTENAKTVEELVQTGMFLQTLEHFD